MRRRISLGGVFVAVVVVVGLSLVAGYRAGAQQARTADNPRPPAAAMAAHKIKYYWDPMLGPSSISDKPGVSAMGMDLVPVFDDGNGAADVGEVRIDPAVVQNMGIRTAVATRGSLTQTIRTVGVLRVPEPAIHEVSLRVSGWIERLYADQEGMHVKAGDPLFAVYSPDLQVAADELISAQKSVAALDPAAAAPVRAEVTAMAESAKRKLWLWGVADQDIDAIAKSSAAPKSVVFRSPADGEITEKMVVDGSSVQAGMKLMRIEDRCRLWLDAVVYEGQMSAIALGQKVEATTDSLPGRTFRGTVTFISPRIDPATQTETIRAVLDNSDLALAPGTYVTVNVSTRPLDDVVMVPREAVIDTGVRQVAFVTKSDGHFTPVEVRLGASGDKDRVQVVQGLSAGDVVVSSGQFLMDVESRTNEAINKLTSARPAETVALAAAPSSAPADGHELFIIHCPMANADWVQSDQTIANPYLGSSMSTCGSVARTVSRPDSATPLAGLVDTYLRVSKSLTEDKVDAPAMQAVKTAAEKLAGDTYTSLRQAADRLAQANTLEAARGAFQPLSDELVKALPPAKP